MTRSKEFSGIQIRDVQGTLKAHPDTNLGEDAGQRFHANVRPKYRSFSFPQVSKIARPAVPGKSRFLTAKAVRNDKKEKVLGCGTAEAVPSRTLRARTLAAASQE
jgi:hypothetical protein